MSALDHGRALRHGSDAPQKWASVAVGAAAILVAGWMTVESMDPRPIKKDAVEAGAPAASGAASTTAIQPILAIDASAAALNLDAGLTLSLPLLGDAALIPTGGPRSVRVGLVFLAFAGAEGASSNARPKAQAKETADRLLPMARADFHQAVTQGDSGSADDLGRMFRGELDPATEAAIFALSTGDVSEVIETTRGYWIVKRLD